MKLAVAMSTIFTLISHNFTSCAQPARGINQIWNYDLHRATNTSIDAAIGKYYESQTFIMSISVYLKYSKPWQNYFLDYMSAGLAGSKLMKYEIFVNSNSSRSSVQRVTTVSYHNLWYVDSYQGFCAILSGIQDDYRRNMGEYVVIMDAGNPLSQARDVQLILEKSFEMNIVNIIVAAYVGNASFLIYSYDVFTAHSCHRVAVKQVNTFKDGQFWNEQLFPYKFNNFHHCTLKAKIRNSSLFSHFSAAPDGKGTGSIEGVEATMMQTMAKKLNFELILGIADNTGVVYRNGTSTGPFRLLVDKQVDVLLGYNSYPSRGRYFGVSTTYSFMPLVIVISEKNAKDFAEAWPFKAFSRDTWSIFAFLFFLAVILAQISHCYCNRRVTWLDVVGLVLGSSRPLHINSYLLRVSVLLCIFGIVIICALFQGRLYYVFNSDVVRPLTNVQQLVKANYTFLLRRIFKKDLIRALQIPLKQIHFVDTFEDYTIYDQMCTYSGNVATVTNYWDFQLYTEYKECTHKFHIFPKVVLFNHICAYMKRYSYLIEPINRVINSLKVGGIFKKWMRDMSNIGKINNIGLATKHKLSDTPTSLTLDKFKIVFAGLMFLYFLSILIFLGEFIARDWKMVVAIFAKVNFFRKQK